jgi:hypothetical protein
VVIGAYVSSLLKLDSLDVMAAFVLQLCSKLHKLDLTGVETIPQVDASVHELVVGGGLPGSSFILLTIPGSIKKINEVKVLRLHDTDDFSDEDLLCLVRQFSALEMLSVSNCPKITEAGARALQETNPRLEIAWAK